MEKFIAKLVKDFEDKKVSRRQLIHTIQVAAATFAAGEQAANAAPAGNSFKTINVNHISYSCPDYTIARDFYQHLMGMGVTQDSGRQCYMPFGPKEGEGPGTFLLPRGYPQAPTPRKIIPSIGIKSPAVAARAPTVNTASAARSDSTMPADQ